MKVQEQIIDLLIPPKFMVKLLWFTGRNFDIIGNSIWHPRLYFNINNTGKKGETIYPYNSGGTSVSVSFR